MTIAKVAFTAAIAVAASLALPAGQEASAAGNLASKPTVLEPLVMKGGDLSFSVKEYTLETGKYYRWHIQADGVEEFTLQAPELFRNSWVNQLSVLAADCPKDRCDVEIMPIGAIYGIQFDEPGAADVYLVPIRPGDYEFYTKGYQGQGMVGKFKVR